MKCSYLVTLVPNLPVCRGLGSTVPQDQQCSPPCTLVHPGVSGEPGPRRTSHRFPPLPPGSTEWTIPPSWVSPIPRQTLIPLENFWIFEKVSGPKLRVETKHLNSVKTWKAQSKRRGHFTSVIVEDGVSQYQL